MNFDRKKTEKTTKTATASSIFAAIAACSCLFFIAGCRGNNKPAEPYEVVIPPAWEDTATTAPSFTEPPISSDEATAEPTEEATPAPVTLRSRALSGEVIPVTGGEPAKAGMEPVSVDIDGDGVGEALSVEDIDGGPVFCIGGEPFLDVGQRVYLTSPDGKNIVFLTEKEGEEGFRMFLADKNGNLFCRFVGRMPNGRAEDFTRYPTWEEHIRAGLEVPLQSPAIYEDPSPDTHTVRLDMDGDGVKEEIVFGGAVLTLNGEDHSELLTATLPRFIFDRELGTIVLYGSAGDLAIRLYIENGQVMKSVSYAQLL